MESEVIRELGRTNAGGYYDLQAVRLATMNRLRDLIRKRLLKIPTNETEAKKQEKKYEKEWTDAKMLSKLERVLESKKHDFNASEVKYLRRMISLLNESEKLERAYLRSLNEYVEQEPVWTRWLGAEIIVGGKPAKAVRGVSTVLTSNLLKEYGYCETYDTVSKLWAHSGLSVTEEGKAKGRVKGERLSYDPKKKVLAWKIADCFIKARGEPYRTIYDHEKERQLAKEYEAGYLKANYNGYKEEDTHLSLGHAHARAMRKASKIFLQHYWEVTRKIKGLETREIYVVEKLGHKNKIPVRGFQAK
jgi:hypothetical protein